jgi:SAM-dependent methyltransferase
VEIVATDLPPDLAIERGWTTSGREYSENIDALNTVGLCPDDAFQRLVTFRHVDMTAIPPEFRGFDFNWSSCAFEHLGSLEAGLDFLVEQMRCLRPGGIAVHTTEYNVSSDDDTVSSGGTVLYRRRDIEAVMLRLRREGYRVQCDFTLGDTPSDRHVDVAPFSDVHLRTRLGEFATTSLGLVVQKPEEWQPRQPDRGTGGPFSRMRQLAGALRSGRTGGPSAPPEGLATPPPGADPR